MFFVRLIWLAIALLFTGIVSGLLALKVDSEAGAGALLGILLIPVVPSLLLYFLPTYEAYNNKHPNLNSIALLNIFLGWTFLGWVISVIWAFAEPSIGPENRRSGKLEDFKKCAFCAEPIRSEATICRFCGRDQPVVELPQKAQVLSLPQEELAAFVTGLYCTSSAYFIQLKDQSVIAYLGNEYKWFEYLGELLELIGQERQELSDLAVLDTFIKSNYEIISNRLSAYSNHSRSNEVNQI